MLGNINPDDPIRQFLVDNSFYCFGMLRVTNQPLAYVKGYTDPAATEKKVSIHISDVSTGLS